MRESFLKKKLIGKSAIVTVFCVLIMLVSMVGAVDVSQQSVNDVKTLSYEFLFKNPSLQSSSVDNNDYTLLEMEGCLAIGESAGVPMLPIKPVKLLIPALKSVENIYVTGTPVELELNDYDLTEKPAFPYQNPVPFGTASEDFVINSNAYSIDAKYPSNLKSDYTIGYSHGYAILDLSLNPVQYNPAKGKVYYYPEMTLNIQLEDSNYINQFFANNPEDRQWVKNLVLNPEVSDTYTSDLPILEYPGGLCDPSDNYNYVIITTTMGGLDYWDTTTQIPYNWESLLNKHASDDGLSGVVVTKEAITACTDYHNSNPLFNDITAHIREFCKDAYEDWGTRYVLIGGDDDKIPARHMKTNYESNIDSDLYWSNLDLNFNANSNTYWGEEGDDGFDLYSEIYIGRLTCDEPQDVSNWMTKSFYYADSIEDVYIDSAAFYGGDTGWQCQGDDFMDYSAIKGTDDWLGPNPHYDGPFPTWAGFQFGFETWNAENAGNEYDLSVAWTAEPTNPGWQGGSESAAINGLKNDINNNNVAFISGIAHADASMSLDVYNTAWESQYTNTKPFFIHDYGCHCGDMDAADDGVLHSMLFHSDTELAFGCVYNTCYGWGNLYCTNSSSAFQAKEFWSYFLDMENKSGDYANWQFGKAHAYSKDRMAPTILWDYSTGTWRAIIQGCLLFGDPAQTFKTPHPSEAPYVPNPPNGPSQWVVAQECDFTVTTTDPDGDVIYYLFDWGDGTYSDWIGPYAPGYTAEASHSWAELGEYEICVRARDSWGAVSDWSEPHILAVIENTAPVAPIVNGQTIFFTGKTYEFTISAQDPNGHDVYYYFMWGDDTNTGWFGPYASGETATVEKVWTKGGKFQISARAQDFIGDRSDWTNIKVYVIKERPRTFSIFERMFERFPLLQQILNLIK